MEHLTFHPFPILTTERLLLRKITEEDQNDLFILRSDKRVMQYIERPLATSVADAKALINRIQDDIINNNGVTWAIALKEQPRLIGTIGFWRIVKEHYRAEIGYALNSNQQGKGLMQEAITAVISYGFNNMRLHSVEASVNPGNLASIKLLERNRFVQEAYFKENYYFNGNFLDTAIYSLINPNGNK